MSDSSDSEDDWDVRQLFDKRKKRNRRIHISPSRSRSRSIQRQTVDLTSEDEKSEEKAQAPPVPVARKKRGRPKGSKNKSPSKEKGRGPQAHNWVLTGWIDKLAPGEEKLDFYWDDQKMNYLCGQVEYSEEKNEKHWQAFVQFKTQVFATAVLKIFPSGKWRNGKAWGSAEQCRAYCKAQPGEQVGKKKKTGRVEKDSFIEFGTMIRQGQEAGLARAAQMIHEGATIKEIFCEVTSTAIRHSQGIKDVSEVVQTKDDTPEFGLDEFKDWNNLEIKDWSKTVVS